MKQELRKKLKRAERSFDRHRIALKNRLGLLDTVIVYPYRGYGNATRARMSGRVLEKEQLIHGEADPAKGGFWQRIKTIKSRFESDELADAKVRGHFLGSTAEAVSDEEGYFTIEFSLSDPPEPGWHPVRIEVVDLPFDVDCETWSNTEILIADEESDFGVISDVDDTILKSHITDRKRMLAALLKKSYETRDPFDGIEHLYNEIGREGNRPVFYVSGSSYNLYDFLRRFCEHHDLPKGVFLLRDFGFTNEFFIHKDTIEYKENQIREILSTYPDLQFVLSGDSGEEDPEIYSRIDEQFPNRIRAVYIRHIAGNGRGEEVKKMGQKMNAPVILMHESPESVSVEASG